MLTLKQKDKLFRLGVVMAIRYGRVEDIETDDLLDIVSADQLSEALEFIDKHITEIQELRDSSAINEFIEQQARRYYRG